MLINVSCPLKREEVKELLTSSENPKIVYVKNKKPMEMQFEVTYANGTSGDAVSDIKKKIKSTEWGKALYFQVLPEGKMYSW